CPVAPQGPERQAGLLDERCGLEPAPGAEPARELLRYCSQTLDPAAVLRHRDPDAPGHGVRTTRQHVGGGLKLEAAIDHVARVDPSGAEPGVACARYVLQPV